MDKLRQLKKTLAGMKSVLVAYSGGVDSSLLLGVAKDVLGDEVLAVTVDSLIYPSQEIRQAKALAAHLKARHQIIKSNGLADPRFANNPKDRCYWCKRQLFAKLRDIARKNRLRYVLDGENFDDLNDFRPGSRAAKELGIRSPLKEARLRKQDIRCLSRRLGLPTWDKPSLACLATRFPYGMKITRGNLSRVDKAEGFLRNLGITQVRVRQYNQTDRPVTNRRKNSGICNGARIEVLKDEIAKLLQHKTREKIVSEFKKLGYTYVTVDLAGYITGSMNPNLNRDVSRANRRSVP
jgi:uncharacterized protein